MRAVRCLVVEAFNKIYLKWSTKILRIYIFVLPDRKDRATAADQGWLAFSLRVA
jgi:hypothetical protein